MAVLQIVENDVLSVGVVLICVVFLCKALTSVTLEPIGITLI